MPVLKYLNSSALLDLHFQWNIICSVPIGIACAEHERKNNLKVRAPPLTHSPCPPFDSQLEAMSLVARVRKRVTFLIGRSTMGHVL